MGMFDYFKIPIACNILHKNLDLVNTEESGWQTKSLGCDLDTFYLQFDGTLVRQAFDYNNFDDDITKVESYAYHGDIVLRDSTYIDKIDNKTPYKMRFIEIVLRFTHNVLSDVMINYDRIETIEPREPLTLLEHTKNVAKLEHIRVPTIFNMYAYSISNVDGKWMVSDHAKTMCLSEDGQPLPFVHIGVFNDPWAACEILKKFIKEVQDETITTLP